MDPQRGIFDKLRFADLLRGEIVDDICNDTVSWGLNCLEIKGAGWLIESAVGLARRFHLPELLIRETIVSMGTSLREAAV